MAGRLRQFLVLALLWPLLPPPAMAQSPAVALPVPPPAPSVQLPAGDAALVTVPFEQSIRLSFPGAVRVVSVNPNIIHASLAAPGVVELRALAFGRTFVHVWSPEGRVTRAVQVVQPPPQRSTFDQQQRAAQELARHLTIEYQNLFRSLQRGPHLEETDRTTSTQFTHDLTAQMESPYGDLRGAVSFQRFNAVNELSAWNASITDGRIGPVKRFAAAVGDTSVGFSDLTLPTTSLRGIQASYYGIDPYDIEVFHGRRRLGLNAALSPQGDAANDILFSGIRVQDLERPWTWKLAYAAASGEDRVEIQTSQAAEASTWYWPSERVGFGAELGRNQEQAYGYRLKSALRGGAYDFEAAYRNLSQRYENLLGTSAEQGERGLLLTARQQPVRTLRLRQQLDIYQDRLFLNPEEPDQDNLDLELEGDVDLTPGLLWGSRYSRQRLLGRLFPTDASTVRTNLQQRLGPHFPLLANGSVFSEYQFRDFRSVTSPDADFGSHSVIFGLGAPLTDVLSWQASQQIGVLKETRTGDRSSPKETSAGINYYQRFTRLPVTLRSGLNYSIASDLGSPNSFLTDQHRASGDGGLRYDVTPNSHLFTNLRVSRRSATGTDSEYELDFETGMRCLLDTGITWEPRLSVSGIVFQDLNADGGQQAEEHGLPHVAVTSGERRALTDPGGRFYLGRIRGRSATISVALDSVPSGFVPTSPSTIELDLTAPPRMPLFFGLVAQAELRVRVFVDGTMNGLFDGTDAPLAGVRVSLADGPTVTTDQAGWAYFRGISPGRHQVTLTLSDLAPGYVPVDPLTQEQAVGEGQAGGLSYRFNAERSIGGLVYLDTNRNGRFDGPVPPVQGAGGGAGEPVLGGMPVCLDDAHRIATREDGRYLFKDVTAGRHEVALNCRAVLRGYLPLGAAVQRLELPPAPVRLEDEDFRLGEEAGVMREITADVLRARRGETRDEAIERVIEELDAASRAARQTAPPAPILAAPAQEPPKGVRQETAVVEVIVDVR